MKDENRDAAQRGFNKIMDALAHLTMTVLLVENNGLAPGKATKASLELVQEVADGALRDLGSDNSGNVKGLISMIVRRGCTQIIQILDDGGPDISKETP